MTGPAPSGEEAFAAEFDRAIRLPSDAAARAMLARGHFIVYCEPDTPPGHVIREHPDGTTELVEVHLPTPKSPPGPR